MVKHVKFEELNTTVVLELFQKTICLYPKPSNSLIESILRRWELLLRVSLL